MNLKVVYLWVFVTLFQSVFAVKRELFKTCDQAGFCRRNRHFAQQVSKESSYVSKYSVDEGSLKVLSDSAAIQGNIEKALPNGQKVSLPFTLNILENDNVRLRIDEEERINPKTMEPPNQRLKTRRFNEAWKYALNGKPGKSSNAKLDTSIKTDEAGHGYFSVIYGAAGEYEAKVDLSPFKLTIYRNNEPQVVLNDRNFINVEHWRSKDKQAENVAAEELDFNAFEDSFKDASGDKLPFGPESVALDVTFNNYDQVYGIPEHADSLLLKDTTNDDPYRLFNVDIFEYETDSKFPMYGSIPFLVAHKKGSTAGLFWINGADTYVDIKKEHNTVSGAEQAVLSNGGTTKTHWFSENGIIDLIIIVDQTPMEVSRKYGALSGNPELPQLFTLGYHQCRWNYNDVDDVLDVSSNFDKHEFPYDVIWLDIEYTENKKYFTWKQGLFDDHVAMNNKLDETGRNLVAIIDPHIKTGYEISDEIAKQNIGIQNSDNEEIYKGHCWPGESVWIDTFNPKARTYWDGLFKNNTQFSADETNLHIWNDMSEPSVFSGSETTAPKDIIHYGNWEHRSVHNIYGLTFHEATYDAMKKRLVNKRPFILTRAYYAGSQRTAAMWSGDNQSKWSYLKQSLPMLLTSQVVGMPFTGSDVGGFFGDPAPELLTRWYQTGIWYPFFRAHAHIDSKRREPYVFNEPYKSLMRDAVKLRYSLLPVFYTSFYHASTENSPVITPLFYSHPDNEESFGLEDQFFVGDSGLLVKPVTDEGATSVSIYIPDDKPYYDYKSHAVIQGKGTHHLDTDLSTIPILIQGGHIFARKDRYRRSAKLMKYDPYTLVVALDSNGTAQGSLYIDDGETFNYKDQEFIYVDFTFQNNKLSAETTVGKKSALINLLDKVKIEKVIVVGANAADKAIVEQQGKKWTVEVQNGNKLVIRNPAVKINKPWDITLV